MATLQRLALRGTPKATKQAARYTPAGGAERCGMCRHYVPSSSCARIEGPVSAAGWCQLYSQQVTWRPRAGQLAGLNPGLVPPGVTLDLSFMAAGTMPQGVTFTRASTATYFDATGTVRTATIDAPRWDYDPVTHALRGLLIEEARTNVLLNSATLGTQSVTVTAQAYTLSFYGTGTVTKSGTATGALVGTGVGQPVSQTFTPTAGTLTLTVTGTVTNAQLEAGSFATSFVPTTATAVTRAMDQCYALVAAWFNASTSSLMTETYNPVCVGQWAGTGDTNFGNAYSMGNGQAFRSGSASSVAPVNGAVNKMASSNTTTRIAVCTNGNAFVGSAAQSVAAQTTATRLSIGMSPWALDSQVNGHVRRVRYWPRALADTELQTVST